MNTTKYWNDRSNKYGDDIKGVLWQSFPPSANKYLDKWTFKNVQSNIINSSKFKILDLGCGYGRLSAKILNKFSGPKTFGIDISKRYVNIYNQNLSPRGKARIGDIRKLPFSEKSMDVVFSVATLMYIIGSQKRKKTFKELFRVLKNDGKLIIIERDISTYKLITFGGLTEKKATIKSNGFSPKELRDYIQENGGKVIDMQGMPFFTLSLPILFILKRINNEKILKSYLKIINKLDGLFKRITFPSLYIAYVCSKV